MTQDVQNEGRTSISECGFPGANPGRSSSQIRQLNLAELRRDFLKRCQEDFNDAILQRQEVSRLGVVSPAMREFPIGHSL